MKGSVVTITMTLEAATRRKADIWLAWCVSLDVMTQAGTKQRALKSLKEAVELWFESCIARNVLDKALLESGFRKAKPGETPPDSADFVRVSSSKQHPAHAFAAKRDYIEVSIPAYISAQSSSDHPRAPR